MDFVISMSVQCQDSDIYHFTISPIYRLSRFRLDVNQARGSPAKELQNNIFITIFKTTLFNPKFLENFCRVKI